MTIGKIPARKNAIAMLLLAIAAFAIFSLASGADVLGDELPGGLPWGNALAAIGLCAAAGAAVALGKRGTALRAAAWLALAAAATWLPVSILLAGNAALNFTGGRGSAWWAFSLAVIAGVVAVLVWASLAAALASLRRDRAG